MENMVTAVLEEALAKASSTHPLTREQGVLGVKRCLRESTSPEENVQELEAFVYDMCAREVRQLSDAAWPMEAGTRHTKALGFMIGLGESRRGLTNRGGIADLLQLAGWYAPKFASSG